MLSNDSDPDYDVISIISLTQPGSGLVVNYGGYVYFYPNPGYVGGDSFTYTIDDGNGGQDTATVYLAAGNRAPVAQDDTFYAQAYVYVPLLLNVLANDSDPDGDPIFYSSTGGLGLDGDCLVYYPYEPGVYYFGYAISDGAGGSSIANITIYVQ